MRLVVRATVGMSVVLSAWLSASAAPPNSKAAGVPKAELGLRTITVRGEVTLLPGSPDELAKLPGPLALLDPKADLDAATIRQLAYDRMLGSLRRRVADQMTAQLADRELWLLREMSWPTTLPAGDPARFEVTAVFDRIDSARPVSDATRKAQEHMLGLFGKVRVITAYDVNPARQVQARALIERVNRELLRGPWEGMPHLIMQPGEDPDALVKRVNGGADIIFQISVTETLTEAKTDAGAFYKCVGSCWLTVYRRGPDGAWVVSHRANLPNTSADRARVRNDRDFEVGGAFSAEEAVSKLLAKIGDSLLGSGKLLDACNRAFAEIHKTPDGMQK